MIIDGIGPAYVPLIVARAKPTVDRRESTTTGLGATDTQPGDIDRGDTAADTTQAVDAVKRAKQDMQRQRKAFSAEKVRRLRQELQTLRTTGGDPKAIARQATRIARELMGAMQGFRAGARVLAQNDQTQATALAQEGRKLTADAQLIHRRLRSALDQAEQNSDATDGDHLIARRAVSQIASLSPGASLPGISLKV